jgi:hypothetical protein
MAVMRGEAAPTSKQPNVHERRSHLDRGVRPHALASPLCLPQHPHEHRPQRPVLLAVDQRLGEGFGSYSKTR